MKKIGMDELFFEMENKNVLENLTTQLTFKPCRVFINHVDSYHGKKLTDVSLTSILNIPQKIPSRQFTLNTNKKKS